MCFSSFGTMNRNSPHTCRSDCIQVSARLHSRLFIYKCRADCTDAIFRRTITCRAKPARLNFSGGEMPFPRDELPRSVILELADVPRRVFSYVDPPSGRWVTLDLTGVPYVTLWSDGGPFLCVEPCWGLTDHHEQRAFEKKQGIQTISPGGELRASFSMTPQFASCD